jgi:tetratricopeptide (TPR) repeat protein
MNETRNKPNSNRSPRRLAATVLLLASLAPAAHAQYALDNNLQAGTRGINPTALSERDVYMFRNAILTGNVANRSFRDNLGYTAPRDFRGELGSNDLYRFARDSYASGLALRGIRSLTSAHQVLAQTDPNSFAHYALARSGEGTDLQEVRSRTVSQLMLPVGSPPAFNSMRGSVFIRSLSARSSDASLRGTIVGYSNTEGGGVTEVGASSLRGMFEEPLMAAPATGVDANQPAPRTPGNAPRTGERLDNRINAGLPQPGQDPYIDLVEHFASAFDTTGLELPSTLTDPELDSVFDERWQRLFTFEEQYRQLTEILQQREEEGDVTDSSEVQPTLPGEPAIEPWTAPERPAPLSTDIDAMLDRYLPKNIREDVRLQDLAGQTDSLFDEQMRRAQALLNEGRYFDAESYFTTALAARPSHPLAKIGKLNSQIGAGLFLSAGATLRGLVVTHPEVFAVRYDERVLPSRERLDEIIEMLQERLVKRPSFTATTALLLSYLGHAVNDPELVESGLEQLEAIDDPDNLVPLLRALWQGGSGQGAGAGKGGDS